MNMSVREYIDTLFDDSLMFDGASTRPGGNVYLDVEGASDAVGGNVVLDGDGADDGVGAHCNVDTTTMVSVPTNVSAEEEGGDVGSDWVPREGILVGGLIEAFIKYSEYAKRNGFEVRCRSSELSAEGKKALGGESRRKKMRRGLSRDWLFGDHELCSRVRLQCVKGGKCQSKRRNLERAVLSHASGCKAGVSIVNNRDGTWVFSKVSLVHNHELDPLSTRFMKNYRMISCADEAQVVIGDRAGLTASRMFQKFVVANGGIDKVPFTAKDCNSVIRRWRLESMENGDFYAMQQFFNEMRSLQEGFFYMYDIDTEGRIKNVFWADGRCRAAYKDFGDVISFDTTHLKNRYKMPLAPFIGVNHHGQSILLGCALLTKEDTESFEWIFQAFMKCMHNNPPKHILTDQCQAIGNAIANTFPHSRHRWCLWHVMRNAERHLKGNGRWTEIRRAVKEAVHDALSPLEFEGMWNRFIIEYELQDNRWLRNMYQVRERWVPAYFLHEFWAGLHSTQRSEGMNNFFRGYVNENTGLRQFAEQYCLAAGKRVDDEEHENFRSLYKPAMCDTRFHCEHVLHKVYTVNKFLELQKEAKGVGYTKIERFAVVGDVQTYNVVDKGVEKVFGAIVTRNYLLSYNTASHETTCQCKLFSFRGIICRHMIAVWQEVDLKIVPELYIFDRWRKDIFRECSLVKVPKYISPFDKTSEYKKLEKLQNVSGHICKMALGSTELYSEVIGALDLLREKCLDIIGNGGDICMDSVGRFYKKQVTEGIEGDEENNVVEHVLDPIDRRGKGRVRKHRVGYDNEKRKRGPSNIQVDEAPRVEIGASCSEGYREIIGRRNNSYFGGSGLTLRLADNGPGFSEVVWL